MPVERSAGIIVFHNTPQGRRYLVLRSSRDESTIAKGKNVREFWDVPKGRLEQGETGIAAARREAEEEAGLENVRIIEGFKETIRYFTRREGKAVPKFVALFLGEAPSDTVRLSWEHDQFAWLAHDRAVDRLTLKPVKEAVEKAEGFLQKFREVGG
ncbi:MAG: NUDIX domain-containing protein [Patescibacteria group bacterium]